MEILYCEQEKDIPLVLSATLHPLQTEFILFASGGGEPSFSRGDILFLTNYQRDPIRVGEVVVFKTEGRNVPIVHRVLRVHEK